MRQGFQCGQTSSHTSSVPGMKCYHNRMLQVTFAEITQLLRSVGSTISAAEGHGCLSGALCVSADYSLDRWLAEIVPAEDETEAGRVAEEVRQPLSLLFSDTVGALRGDAMEFEPLLPDDDVPLEQRTLALSQWCQGFLYGFGSARQLRADELPNSIDEVLRDLADISRAEVDVIEAGEEQEQSYTDLVEYLRAGVQLVHDELVLVRAGAQHSADMRSDDAAADYGTGATSDETDDLQPEPNRPRRGAPRGRVPRGSMH